ncbi:MAG: hypothetical protein QGI86_27105 [Candidatus Poribacteria bacterium]|jgi:transcriptional regulator with XRE-family HTH domain|nr:hypothetical protein [Candidatus Poribacteria bacterium]
MSGQKLGQKIKDIITQQGFRIDKVAEGIGMTRGSLSRKINHRQGLRLSAKQIEMIGEIINKDLSAYAQRADNYRRKLLKKRR